MQDHLDKQPSEASKVGKKVGMSDRFIPTSFPLSGQNVGTAVPTFIPTSRAALAARRHSKASAIVSLVLLIAYASLAVYVYCDYRESKAELDRAHASFCESMDKLEEEMERNRHQRMSAPRNSLPPTPEDNVNP